MILTPNNLIIKHFLKAQENINRAKAMTIEKKLGYAAATSSLNSDLKLISDLTNEIYLKIKEILPSTSQTEIHKITFGLLKLEKKYSAQIDKAQENIKPYLFIKNEENIVKENKIKSFLKDKYNNRIDEKALNTNAGTILDLIEMNNTMFESIRPTSTLSKKIRQDRILFEAAAAYRTSMIMALHDDDMQTDL